MGSLFVVLVITASSSFTATLVSILVTWVPHPPFLWSYHWVRNFLSESHNFFSIFKVGSQLALFSCEDALLLPSTTVRNWCRYVVTTCSWFTCSWRCGWLWQHCLVELHLHSWVIVFGHHPGLVACCMWLPRLFQQRVLLSTYLHLVSVPWETPHKPEEKKILYGQFYSYYPQWSNYCLCPTVCLINFLCCLSHFYICSSAASPPLFALSLRKYPFAFILFPTLENNGYKRLIHCHRGIYPTRAWNHRQVFPQKVEKVSGS